MTAERLAWEYSMSSRRPDPPQKRHSRELRQLNKFQKYLNSTDFTLPAGQRQGQLQLIQKEMKNYPFIKFETLNLVPI
jgi:hypothetical protein